jgi:hypothetical protein
MGPESAQAFTSVGRNGTGWCAVCLVYGYTGDPQHDHSSDEVDDAHRRNRYHFGLPHIEKEVTYGTPVTPTRTIPMR